MQIVMEKKRTIEESKMNIVTRHRKESDHKHAQNPLSAEYLRKETCYKHKSLISPQVDVLKGSILFHKTVSQILYCLILQKHKKEPSCKIPYKYNVRI